MEKILFYMQDKTYAEIISKKLNQNYENYSFVMLDELPEEEDKLIISDYNLGKKYKFIDFSKDNIKYQSIEKIYEIITEGVDKIARENKIPKILIFANFDTSEKFNEILFDISKEINKNYNSLIINFDAFKQYTDSISEICIDSLLFLDENTKNINTNIIGNTEYISSTKLPLQFENIDNIKKVFNIIKSLSYDFILIDISLNINKRNLEIFNYSNSLILYGNLNTNERYYKNLYTFLKNNLKEKINIFYLSKNKSNFNLAREETQILINSNINKLVNKLC